MALDATEGGSASNSYVTEAYADSYFETHMYASAWETVADSEAALVYATTILDSIISWFGESVTDTQALNWPRYLPDDPYTSVFPEKVKRATCELALHLINNTELFDSEALTKLAVGPIKLDFNVDNVIQMLPRLVVSMISEYGAVISGDASGIQTPKLVRV